MGSSRLFFDNLVDGGGADTEHPGDGGDGDAFLKCLPDTTTSSVTRRGLGLGVKVFRQALQQRRMVPLRLVPWQMTGSDSPQAGQE
jgi:hypothetical protein